MRALLEQLSPQIATLLRKRGHDVGAVAEREDLIGSSDRTILEVAAADGRAVITNNIKDFRPLAAERLARHQAHGGLILLPSRTTRTRALVEPLADAIEAVLRANPDGLDSSERSIGPLKDSCARHGARTRCLRKRAVPATARYSPGRVEVVNIPPAVARRTMPGSRTRAAAAIQYARGV